MSGRLSEKVDFEENLNISRSFLFFSKKCFSSFHLLLLPRMVAKKKPRTIYSSEDFTRIYSTKGKEELERIASTLISSFRRGHRDSLSSLSLLASHTLSLSINVITDEQFVQLANHLQAEYNCTKALKQCLDLFEFAIGMLPSNTIFHEIASEMTADIPKFLTNLKKSRKVLSLLPEIVLHRVKLPRRVFTSLLSIVVVHLNEWTVDDVIHIVILLTDIVQNVQVGGAYQLHDILLQEVVNKHLITVYLELSGNNQGEKNRKLRATIHSYLRNLLTSLPICSLPSLDGERPIVDKWRRGLLTTALKQYSIGFHCKDESSGMEMKQEALQLMAHFVFPAPAHFAFTDERIHRCIAHSMRDSDISTKKLAVEMASSLIYISWLHVYAPEHEYDLLESPYHWLSSTHPDILFKFGEIGFLAGIAPAIEWAEPVLRERLLELFTFYVCEDTDGQLIEELEDAEIGEYIRRMDKQTISDKEKMFIEIILSSISSADDGKRVDSDTKNDHSSDDVIPSINQYSSDTVSDGVDPTPNYNVDMCANVENKIVVA